LMDALGVERAELIGHSLGGAIALRAAIDHPTRVAALALIAPAGLGSEINSAYLGGFIAADSRKEMKPLLEQLVADPNLVTRALVNDMLQFKRIDGVPAALTTIARGFTDGGVQTGVMRDALAKLNLPVTVIWGDRDQIIPVAHASGLPATVKVHVLAGCGHLVQLEAAAEVNKLLL